MSQWNAQLTAGSETVKSVLLSITGAKIDQFWELTNQSNGLFALPDYRLQNGGLMAGQTHQFGYIWESSAQATITVSSIDCGAAASPSASPAAPSPSAAPASPSASPAAPSPSASPSAVPTIVSTPQPSGCSVTAKQDTRSASQGGSWTSGDYQFQIYDLTFTNAGNQPATDVKITITVSSDAQDIYQFWNIVRESANSASFDVPTTWGPIQVGASQGAGYIVRSLISAGQLAAPSVAVTSTTCAGAVASPSPSATPSPSALPTIVSTPQPSPASGCSATVTLSARSAANGGVWIENGSTFQIFDITLANNGQRPINGGVLTFTFAESGASITQFWELSRQGSTNAFNVAFNYGPLQVGATQGAGIVVSLAGSTAAATPAVILGSLGCQ
jgi:hypothetical protein